MNSEKIKNKQDLPTEIITERSKKLDNIEILKKRIKVLKDNWCNKLDHKIEDDYLSYTNLSPAAMNDLKKKIENGFIKKTLHKGATEVYYAASYMNLEPEQKIYIVGYLDLSYEEALIKILCQTKKDISIVRLPSENLPLVHECIKDINQFVLSKPRQNPRRKFNCRLFLV